MRRINFNKIMCSTLSLITLCCSAVVFAKDDERTITLQDNVTTAELIKIDISAGQVLISGTTGNTLTAELTASCQPKKDKESCTKLLKELAWSRTVGSTIELGLAPSGINRFDDMNIQVKFGIPKDKKLEVNLSAGELRIDGTSACLTASVNAGEIQIKLKEDQLASAELSAKVGDVKLTTAGNTIEGNRSWLVGASLDWNKGTGTCHTKASILAGEAQLVLNQ